MIDLPLAFAFSAGMVATVNPCGFAMLPSFVSYLLGADQPGFEAAPLGMRSCRALVVGATVTLGFVAVFTAVGLLVVLGGRAIFAVVPFATLAIGAVLIGLGLALLLGRTWYFALPWPMPWPSPSSPAAACLSVAGGAGLTPGIAASGLRPRFPPYRNRMGGARRVVSATTVSGLRPMFLYGVGYAIASLSCTLPIFLAVVSGALVAKGTLPGLLMFVGYATGMGAVLSAVALGAAIFKGVVARWLRGLLPYVERLSGALLIAGGAYLVYYQVSITLPLLRN